MYCGSPPCLTPNRKFGMGEWVLLAAAEDFERREKSYNHTNLSIHHLLFFSLLLCPLSLPHLSCHVVCPSSPCAPPSPIRHQSSFQIVCKKLLARGSGLLEEHIRAIHCFHLV